MTLYAFDGIDEALDLLPLAARRALDRAGMRLSRQGWQSLPLEIRHRIVTLGAERDVETAQVISAIASATPAPSPMAPVADPPPEHVPEHIRAALGDRPLGAAAWAALDPLGRYALAKVCERGRSERIEAAYDEIVGHSAVSSHVAAAGGVRMVDVGPKPVTERRAVAEACVTLGEQAYDRLRRHDVPKGDVLATARIAGILAAKKTPELIPLCHQVRLTRVTVEFELTDADHAVRVLGTAEAADRTGVEMECLVAVSVAALTIYDMLKGVDRGIVIGPTRLVHKSGGRTGDFTR